MVQKKNAPRTEYLAIAAIVIVIALVMVIIMIATGAGKGETPSVSEETATSSELSQAESSKPEESSEPEENWTNMPAGAHKEGIVAVISLPENGREPEEPTSLVNVYASKNDCFGLSGSGLELEINTMNAFNDLMQAFNEAKGKNNVVLHQGYTKRADLTAEEEQKKADLTTGKAVCLSIYPADPDGDSLGTGKFTWLIDNCTTYGFILRYPSEKSQYTGQTGSNAIYRFVGYTHASYMGKYHYCLEEYLNYLKENTSFDTPVLFEQGGKNGDRPCNIYYVPADGIGATKIDLPGGVEDYEISGNGTDGYVVIAYLPTAETYESNIPLA